jgi:hypothetical protein
MDLTRGTCCILRFSWQPCLDDTLKSCLLVYSVVYCVTPTDSRRYVSIETVGCDSSYLNVNLNEIVLPSCVQQRVLSAQVLATGRLHTVHRSRVDPCGVQSMQVDGRLLVSDRET